MPFVLWVTSLDYCILIISLFDLLLGNSVTHPHHTTQGSKLYNILVQLFLSLASLFALCFGSLIIRFWEKSVTIQTNVFALFLLCFRLSKSSCLVGFWLSATWVINSYLWWFWLLLSHFLRSPVPSLREFFRIFSSAPTSEVDAVKSDTAIVT